MAHSQNDQNNNAPEEADDLEHRLNNRPAISLHNDLCAYVIPSYHPAQSLCETEGTKEIRRTLLDGTTDYTQQGNISPENTKPAYITNQEAKRDGPFRPDAPVTWMIPFVDVRLLPPDQIGRHIRGYCTPGYQDDKVARIRNNDEDPWRVAVHETLHFAKIYGGDGSEEYVHLLEHWRMEE